MIPENDSPPAYNPPGTDVELLTEVEARLARILAIKKAQRKEDRIQHRLLFFTYYGRLIRLIASIVIYDIVCIVLHYALTTSNKFMLYFLKAFPVPLVFQLFELFIFIYSSIVIEIWTYNTIASSWTTMPLVVPWVGRVLLPWGIAFLGAFGKSESESSYVISKKAVKKKLPNPQTPLHQMQERNAHIGRHISKDLAGNLGEMQTVQDRGMSATAACPVGTSHGDYDRRLFPRVTGDT